MGKGKGRNFSNAERFPRYRYPSVYRPVDVVHLRQELLNITRHTPQGREFTNTERLAAPQRWTDPGTGLLNHIDGLDDGSIARWLEYADLYLVTGPMENMARQAGARMPEVAIYEEDLPSPRGLLIWGEGTPARMDLASAHAFRTAQRPRGQRHTLDQHVASIPMRGILWSKVATKLGPGIAVIGLGDMTVMAAEIQRIRPDIVLDPDIRRWPTSLGDMNPIMFGESGLWPGSPVGATLIASWFLMTQTVSVTTHERVQLPARQPGETRAPDQEVRVVTLRRAKTVSEYGREPGNPGRGYSVQFPVDGHWHTYWTGQGRAVKRIRWVETYMKGDPDAPLIGGERVHLLRR